MFSAVLRLGSLRLARLVPSLLATALFVAAAAAFLPRTESGRPCPLAEARRTTSAQHGAGEAASRESKPGDADFQQCRCAEEKAGAAKPLGGSCAELPPAMLPAIPASGASPCSNPCRGAFEDTVQGPDVGRSAPPTPPPVRAA